MGKVYNSLIGLRVHIRVSSVLVGQISWLKTGGDGLIARWRRTLSKEGTVWLRRAVGIGWERCHIGRWALRVDTSWIGAALGHLGLSGIIRGRKDTLSVGLVESASPTAKVKQSSGQDEDCSSTDGDACDSASTETATAATAARLVRCVGAGGRRATLGRLRES